MALSWMPRSVLACSRPSHADWLKDLSFRRSTSVTRPTFNDVVLVVLPLAAGVSVAAAPAGVSVAAAAAGVSVAAAPAAGVSVAAGAAGVGVLSAPHAANIGPTISTAAVISPD